MTELETKIENAAKVEIRYKPPYEYKFAIVEYYARQGKPLKVVSYYIYGEELTLLGLDGINELFGIRR